MLIALRDETIPIEAEVVVVGGEHRAIAVLLVKLELGREEISAPLMSRHRHLRRTKAKLVLNRRWVELMMRFK